MPDQDPGALEFLVSYRFPHLIALPYRRMRVCPDPLRQVPHMERTWEMLLRYLFLVALAEYGSCPTRSEEVDRSLVGSLPRLVHGRLLRCLRTLVQFLQEQGHDFLMPEIHGNLFRGRCTAAADFNELLELRNLGHHLRKEALTSRDGARRLLQATTPHLSSLLARFESLADYPLVATTAAPGASGRIGVQKCMGAERIFPYLAVEADLAVDRVLLLDRELTEYLDLDPLLRFLDPYEEESPDLYLLESLDKGRVAWWSIASGHLLSEKTPRDPAAAACHGLVQGPGSANSRAPLSVAPWCRPLLASGCEPRTEAQVEGYEYLAELRSGGSCEVFLARHRPTGEVRALKVLRPDLAADGALRGSFENSARRARGLDHPRILQVLEEGHWQGRPYLAMPYLPGGDLRERILGHGPLEPVEAADLVLQILDGLEEMHRRGLVHRDLKPANILFDEAGGPQIADLGLAELTTHQEETGRNTVQGTVGYAPPEQARGAPADPRQDLYAVGALLAALASGADPPDPTIIPRPLRPLVDWCMQIEPQRRPDCVASLREALLTFRRTSGRESGLPRPSPGASDLPLVPAQQGQRVMAWLIDTLPIYGIWALIPCRGPYFGWLDFHWFRVLLPSSYLLVAGWHALLDARGRRLPGRRMMGVRLVRADGRPPDPLRVLLRFILANPFPGLVFLSYTGVLESFLPTFLAPVVLGLAALSFFVPLLNLLVMQATGGRTLHDLCTGTMVIQEAPGDLHG